MKVGSLIADFGTVKAEYKAASPSRFWRTRTGLGGNADVHLTQSQYWNLREYSRDADRNDSIFGQMIDRAIDNIVGTGLSLEVKTSDKALNDAIWERFTEWANDPSACCARRMFVFGKQERLSLRHRFIDGDIFGLPLDSGRLQLVEGDRCLTPSGTTRNVAHGIFLDDLEAPIEYWFTKQKRRDVRVQRVAEMKRYGAFDQDGNPQVFHMFDAKRVTQTRGVPVLAPVFDLLTMFEDVNFAKLVQAQVISCIAAFLERDKDFKGKPDAKIGPRETEDDEDSTTRTLEKIKPGIVIKGRKGEKLTAFSPNVPNAEYFDHVRLLLRLIGANIGLPLSLVLMDTHDTTFHGYRGELNEARKAFKRVRKEHVDQLNSPVYRWKVREWADAGEFGATGKKMLASREIYRHKWFGEGWPYVEPKTDAEADVVALKNMLESPREQAMRRGRDFDDIVTESIDDNGTRILAAIQKAKEISTQTGVEVSWRDVLQPIPDKAAALQAPAEKSPEQNGGKAA